MRIGAALVLLAVGAILRFAIATTSTHGTNVHVIGDILMAVGALGLILWLIVWAPWTRSRRSDYGVRPPLDDAEAVYRQDTAYRRGERY
jgi:hypothetical protein